MRTGSRPIRWRLSLLLAAGLAAGCGTKELQGDARRGEVLHASCLSCHGTDIYAAPERKVKSPDQLKAALKQWNDIYSPGFNEQEMADLLAYMNTNFYKF